MGWGFWEASGTYPAKPDPSTPPLPFTTTDYSWSATRSITVWMQLFVILLGCWSTHAIEYLRLSSIQRNIVLLCKRRIPESKLLALFKPLRITFLHRNISTLCSFSHANNNSGRHIAMFKWLVTRPRTHAMEACILNVTQIRIRAGASRPE